MASGKQLTTEDFIKKSNVKHNYIYDYSKTIYTKAKEKVCIICPIHGEFWQLPLNHLKGCGCHINHGKRVWDTRGRITTEGFINRAKEVHGDKYDYSLVEYKNMNTKVEIICNKCGRHFKQKPNNHINMKQGCPFCAQSKLETEVDVMLKCKNILFEKQKRFSWLGRQSLDFYLPEYNIAIECQGEQHYKPVDFGGKGIKWATEQFQYNVKKDKIKKQKCENNGVKLLYYSNSNKNIIL